MEKRYAHDYIEGEKRVKKKGGALIQTRTHKIIIISFRQFNRFNEQCYKQLW